jgi:hypothetical protein
MELLLFMCHINGDNQTMMRQWRWQRHWKVYEKMKGDEDNEELKDMEMELLLFMCHRHNQKVMM